MTDVRALALESASRRLAVAPLSGVTWAELVQDAGVPVEQIARVYPTVHVIASAVLDHERASMRTAQERAFKATVDPLERLTLVFQFVGESLATDMLVRAGVRIASESRHLFPERRLDPFATWEKFVSAQLIEGASSGLIREGIDVPAAVRVLVAAGMGTVDLLAFHDAWDDAPPRL